MRGIVFVVVALLLAGCADRTSCTPENVAWGVGNLQAVLVEFRDDGASAGLASRAAKVGVPDCLVTARIHVMTAIAVAADGNVQLSNFDLVLYSQELAKIQACLPNCP